MIFSKRERYVSIMTIGVLGILVFDWMILSPLLARRAELIKQMATIQQKDMKPAQALMANKKRMDVKWKGMEDAGLKKDASTAESQVLNAVQVWAQEAGLNLSSLKPERSEQEGQFQKITIRAAGVGGMTALSRFLGRIQGSALPLRVSDIAISSHKDGMDDLSIQVGISTLCMAAEIEKPGKSGVAGGAREEAKP